MGLRTWTIIGDLVLELGSSSETRTAPLMALARGRIAEHLRRL